MRSGNGKGLRRSLLRRRVWLLSGRDLLLGHRNSLLSGHLLRARRVFGNDGCSDRIVMDLLTLIRRSVLDKGERTNLGVRGQVM